MSEDFHTAATGNPFSTRYVRPGAIPFLFPPETDCESLLRQLRKNGWQGQILGPHGSGKSALVATLIAALRSQAHPIEWFELHDGQRRLPGGLERLRRLPSGTLVVVDGYEQLSLWNRLQVRRYCRQQGLGLLVTTHAPAGLPTLFATNPNPILAERIVQCLLGEQTWPVSREELHRRYCQHRGDLRELLFDLYDAYEQRRPA